MIYKIDISTDPDFKFWNITEAPGGGKIKCYDIEKRTFLLEDPEDVYGWGISYEVEGVSFYVSDVTPLSALSQAIMVLGG